MHAVTALLVQFRGGMQWWVRRRESRPKDHPARPASAPAEHAAFITLDCIEAPSSRYGALSPTRRAAQARGLCSGSVLDQSPVTQRRRAAVSAKATKPKRDSPPYPPSIPPLGLKV